MAEALGAAGAGGMVGDAALARRQPFIRGWSRRALAAPGRTARFILLVGQSLFLLAGCAGTGEAPRAAIPDSGITKQAAGSTMPKPELVSLPSDGRGDLGRLRSLSSREVLSLLGDPDFRRDEPPAQLWQYRAGACVLDVFLYAEGGTHRVAYADWRARDTDGPAPQSCMDQIIRARATTETAARF